MGCHGLGRGLAIGALAVSGCGSAQPPGDPAATTSLDDVAAVQPQDRPQTGEQRSGVPAPMDSTGPTFPLTVRRTGGIADFHDTVVLRADGTVLVDTPSVRGRVCTLSQAQQRSLLAALSTLSLGVPATPLAPPEAGRNGSTGSVGSGDGSVVGDGSGSGGAPGDGSDSDGESSRIRISVADVHDRPVHLDDPSLADVSSMVSLLVSDVTLTTPAATRCATPASTVSPAAPTTPVPPIQAG